MTPSWIVDSIKESKILDESNYAPCKAEVKPETERTSSLLTPDDNDTTMTTLLPANKPHATSPSVSTPVLALSKVLVTLPSTLMSPVSPVVTTTTESKVSTTVQSVSSLAVPVSDEKIKSTAREEDNAKELRKTQSGKENVEDTLAVGVKIVENNNEALESDKENKDVSKDKDQGKSTDVQGLKKFYGCVVFLITGTLELYTCTF